MKDETSEYVERLERGCTWLKYQHLEINRQWGLLDAFITDSVTEAVRVSQLSFSERLMEDLKKLATPRSLAWRSELEKLGMAPVAYRKLERDKGL